MTEATYTADEAKARFLAHGLAISRLYRRVKEDAIKSYLPAGRKRGATYSKADVDRICASEGKKIAGTSQASVNGGKSVGLVEEMVIRPLASGDIGDVYRLLFKQLRFEYAVQPSSLQTWVEEGLPLFWVAQDPQNSDNIWGTLGVVPLDEELIIRFLRGEFTLQEIAIADILPYQRGRSRVCYLIAAADPAHPDALIGLMEHLLSSWCEHYPDISIRKLFASTPLPVGMTETPLLHMLYRFFFWRRSDISPNLAVWELPLKEFNPAPAIRQFQKCIEEKRSMLILANNPVADLDVEEGQGFGAPLQSRPAKTKADVAALVQIGAEIFVPPGVTPSIPNDHQTEVWYAWLQKNPEIFHIVTVFDEIIGYISLIPLPQDVIDKVMRGAHPTTITPDDVLLFEPGKPLNVYAHMWGTTSRLATSTQKRIAGSEMLRELRRMFVNDFGPRGVDIRSIYTRSDKPDGIRIAKHLGMKDIDVPGITDAVDEHKRKRVFRGEMATSENPIIVEYRRVLAKYRATQKVS